MGEKVNIKDVAREAGVSIATVSYVINNINKVTDNTRNRVLEVIERLGYQPNINARSLVKKESRIIGIIVPVSEKEKDTILLDNPFYLEFLSSVENKVRINGYSTMILSIYEEKELIKHLNSGSLAGIIVLGSANKFVYDTLSSVDIPVVVVDQKQSSDRFYYINTDNDMGAFLATEYLIKNGHRNICILLGGKSDTMVYNNRLDGYKNALSKYGIEYDEKNVIEIDVSYDGGIEAVEQILKINKEITGIFAISDVVAMGVIRGLYDRNINVPRDKSVIGFDNIRNSKYFIPQLTTINQFIPDKAETAVNIIMKINNKDVNFVRENLPGSEVTIPVHIVERESVRDI